MDRLFLGGLGVTLLGVSAVAVVGLSKGTTSEPSPVTAAHPRSVVVPLAVDRTQARDAYWTVTSSAGMAYARDGDIEVALTGVSPTTIRRSEAPDRDAEFSTGAPVATSPMAFLCNSMAPSTRSLCREANATE